MVGVAVGVAVGVVAGVAVGVVAGVVVAVVVAVVVGVVAGVVVCGSVATCGGEGGLAWFADEDIWPGLRLFFNVLAEIRQVNFSGGMGVFSKLRCSLLQFSLFWCGV